MSANRSPIDVQLLVEGLRTIGVSMEDEIGVSTGGRHLQDVAELLAVAEQTGTPYPRFELLDALAVTASVTELMKAMSIKTDCIPAYDLLVQLLLEWDCSIWGTASAGDQITDIPTA